VTGDQYNRLLNRSRVLVGLAACVAPGQAFRGAGLDTRRNPQLPYMTRLFGIRDLVLGLGALTTGGDERRRWLQATVAADLGDAVAAVVDARAGNLPPHGAVMLTVSALSAAGLGIAALATGD